MSEWWGRIRRFVPWLVALAVVVAGVVVITGGPAQKTATAYFPTTVHLYAGSDVDVLGVKIGSVQSVTPEGTRVKVVIAYDADRKVPANVSAVVLDPTLVADRVVQLAPVYSGGPVLGNGATIPLNHNEVPIELDQINASLVRLSNALGPNGANKHGALSRAIRVGDSNLHGEGQQAHTTIVRMAQLLGTLAGNRKSLFGTVDNLQSFTSVLAHHDAQTRTFMTELARVSGQLDGERGAFGAALHNLQLAMGEVAGFIRDNRRKLASDVNGLATVTRILARERVLLAHMVDMGAVGVSNYPHMYTPSQRTYNARFDGNSISDNPALFVCQLLGAAGGSPSQCVKILGPIVKNPPPTGGG